MYKILRIIFCVLAVAAAAATVFVFVYAGWQWGLGVLAFCLLCTGGMFLCRNAQVKQEERENPPPPTGDFITGKVKKDDGEDK